MSSNLSFRWECPRLALSMVCKTRFKRVSKDCCFAAHKRLSASSICFSIATLASSASMLLRSSTIAAWKTCGKLETASHTDWSQAVGLQDGLRHHVCICFLQVLHGEHHASAPKADHLAIDGKLLRIGAQPQQMHRKLRVVIPFSDFALDWMLYMYSWNIDIIYTYIFFLPQGSTN